MNALKEGCRGVAAVVQCVENLNAMAQVFVNPRLSELRIWVCHNYAIGQSCTSDLIQGERIQGEWFYEKALRMNIFWIIYKTDWFWWDYLFFCVWKSKARFFLTILIIIEIKIKTSWHCFNSIYMYFLIQWRRANDMPIILSC